MKTFILALLLVSSSAFADDSYLTFALGDSQTGPIESIGFGIRTAPDINVEANYYHFSDINNSANPVLADLSFNPVTKKCNTNPCKTETGNAHSKSDVISISALLKGSSSNTDFYFIRAGLTYSRNKYSVDYATNSITSSWSNTSYGIDPIFGFGYRKNKFSIEIDGYPAMYYYSHSLVSVMASYHLF